MGLFLLSVGLTRYYIHHAWQKHWVAVPNARSTHIKPVPDGAGLVFVGIWWIGNTLLVLTGHLPLHIASVLLPATLLVAITGFLDDRHNISARLRLVIYCLASLLCIIALGGLSQITLGHFLLKLSFFGSVIALLAVLWYINLFNFMDGLDGLTAVESLFIFGVGGFLLAQAGAYALSLTTWALASCVAGFWVWNTPPAKVFMGDVGSTTLGFLVMAIALLGEKYYGVPLVLWCLLSGTFITDATLTLLRRLFARDPILRPHRLHAFQRLHKAGFHQTQILKLFSIVNTILSLLAVLGFYQTRYLPLYLAMSILLLLVCYLWIERICPMYPRSIQ